MATIGRSMVGHSNPLAAMLIIAGGAAGLASLGGCKTKTVIAEPPPPAYQPIPAYDAAGRLVTEPIDGASAVRAMGNGPQVVSRHRLGVPEDSNGVAAEALPGGPAAAEMIRIEQSWRNADVSDVLKVLLKDFLEQDYILDAKVGGQVTLELNDEMTRADLRRLVDALASIYGWALEQRGDVLLIRPGVALPRIAEAPIIDARPAFPSEQPVVWVRRLRYTAAEQMATMLRDLGTEGAKVVVAGRFLVIADTSRQAARLSRLVQAIDVPSFDGSEVWTYRLSHRRPEDAAKTLDQIATSAAINAGNEPNLAFVALPGTPLLMVIARDATLQPLAYDLVREVDQPIDARERRRYVYRVQHYPQAAILKTLQDFFGDQIEQGATAPGAPGSGEPRMRVIADPQSDLLLIQARPSDYAELLATLSAIDRPPQQAIVQSIIAEVRLTGRLERGVEYFLSSESGAGFLDLVGRAPLANAAAATGSAFFVGGDGFAVIQALDQESATKILSQPKITVTDRANSSIQVGGEVPVLRASQGASTQQAGSSDIREEIEYRDTGVIFSVDPLINESGLITLKIALEITAAIPTTIENQPEFTKRKIETTVTVPHGQTVLLGGIITQDTRESTDRIPLLGRVPVLGEAFKNQQDSKERTELLLAITPTILNDPNEMTRRTSEFIESVAGIKSVLHEFAAELPRSVLSESAAPDPVNPEPETEGIEEAPAGEAPPAPDPGASETGP